MFRRIVVTALAVVLTTSAIAENLPRVARSDQADQQVDRTKEVLTDAAIISIIIAGSIALYKARGKPCACPEDRYSTGRICGGNAAYIRPNGAKPLCYARDITPAMIAAYRATKAIPSPWW